MGVRTNNPAILKQVLDFKRLPIEEMKERSVRFGNELRRRRSVREFSSDPVPDEVIRECLLAAGSAPNGANLQPWHFAVVESEEIKKRIRDAAEEEERAFYQERASDEWLEVLAPLGTDASKPFLEEAPLLIVVFQKSSVILEDGAESKTYYAKESVGLATGFLIAALHQAGLATLTHTPSPMGFLNRILDRPSSEKPFLVLVVGFPSDGCEVPVIDKLSLDEISSRH